MFDLYAEFQGLVEALAAQQIDYAVCGGLAMGIHVEVARARGFELEALPMRFKDGAIEIRRISKVSPDDVLMRCRATG